MSCRNCGSSFSIEKNTIDVTDEWLAAQWSKKNDDYPAKIRDRSPGDDLCPYCKDKILLVGFNGFSDRHPEEMPEWNYLFNYLLADPRMILSSYDEDVWWNCPRLHSYDLSPKRKLYYRMRGMEPCPICKGRRRKKTHFY